ncbi:MAG: TraR/DksA family transcriptional regulator [bacterium]|nr:TraR/DksA family transcriptional regulator [bacterium]
MLSADQLEGFRAKLTAARATIADQLTHVVDDVSFGRDTEDTEEETDEVEEISNRLGMKVALQDQLSRVSAALDKIGAGTYGACERCVSPIDIEVLDVDPESTLCRNCKRGTRDASK